MSENILKALMQLFAIIARPDSNSGDRRPVVESFLKLQLNQELVNEYLEVFDNFYDQYQKKQSETSSRRRHISASSVRVLTICTVINKELTLKQKFIVVIRLLEFINSEGDHTEQELEFVATVAETFFLKETEYKLLQEFVLGNRNNILSNESILLIDSEKRNTEEQKIANHLFTPSLKGQIFVLNIITANMYVFLYEGTSELYLNGQLIHLDRIYVLSNGSSIRDSKRKPIYYSDIISAYSVDDFETKVTFEVSRLEYKFKNGAYGIRTTNFVEESGKLVGIMGASGAGKSTILSILNGTLNPTAGEVLINGINIHKQSEEIEGIIGHVSQDDLLIEELSVFENLFFNAKLCFTDYSIKKLYRTVLKMLKSLGLYEIKDMIVGSPLNKKISGGQRKRLNIALELIREPSVLFLDEPTSGLSSSDSEKILDLLKELTLKGKLIFVVIHQPSSDIFKMFDKLLILDTGGYLIYNGDPVDSIAYFKSLINYADWEDSECSTCGNVNPEQIFNIIEAKVLDEYGSVTQTRKTSPPEWYNFFNRNEDEKKHQNILVTKLPEILFKIPGKLKQFKIFSQRDFKSKLANKQYLFINLMEAPLLAFIISYLIKYYNVASSTEAKYIFSENNNFPVYIFMSVIIAVFMGLSISAQEIIKDRTLLKREQFLNLSRSSYLFSKIFILFCLSAYQSLTYVLIGNYLLEVQGMNMAYWLVLFTTWAVSVLTGLNISDGFKTSITIYIIIPFLIIPQIILSGIIVKYDQLNPNISSPKSIPWYGEIIVARWAYEALAVHQFKNNEYQEPLFEFEMKRQQANYKKDIWLKELENRILFCQDNLKDNEKKQELIKSILLIYNEFNKEIKENSIVKFKGDLSKFNINSFSENELKLSSDYLKNLKKHYIKMFNEADTQKDKYISSQTKTDSMKNDYDALKRETSNKRLEDILTNSDEIQSAIVYDDEIIRKSFPIYKYPETNIKAHFYSPKKLFLGIYYDTYWFNIIICWLMIVLYYISLYFRLLDKLFNFSEQLSDKLNKVISKWKK